MMEAVKQTADEIRDHLDALEALPGKPLPLFVARLLVDLETTRALLARHRSLLTGSTKGAQHDDAGRLPGL